MFRGFYISWLEHFDTHHGAHKIILVPHLFFIFLCIFFIGRYYLKEWKQLEGQSQEEGDEANLMIQQVIKKMDKFLFST